MSATELKEQIVASKSPLMSADQLNQLIGAPDVKIFDVRGTWSTPARALPEEYEAGHIEGAAFLDWTKYFNEQDVPIGQASIVDEVGASRAFKNLGIDRGDLVVLYDDYSHMQAGRIWLAMRHWGFTDVRILNGGWKYWSAQNYPVSTDVPLSKEGTFKPTLQRGLKLDIDDFLKTHEESCVIDARGAISYAGNPDDPRTGHVPGSLNIPFSSLLDPDTGLFLDKETISSLLDEKAEEWRSKPIIVSCGSGYAATVILLGLAELGWSATLFDGSFAIWKQDPDRPIEQSTTQ